ncbi:hypothetical protein E4K10_37485 [Streptomyces sp. T1317-0309]|nr:hypothetical protein E4K10_37485 [Streptomyces sp. T1317-0309]
MVHTQPRPTVHPHTASTDHVDDAWAKERMCRAWTEDAPRASPRPDTVLRHPHAPDTVLRIPTPGRPFCGTPRRRAPFCGGRTPLAGRR